MDEHDPLAKQFEQKRAHLRAVAHRMLGSPAEAEDAVQEAWLRLSRSGTDGVENLGGWLTTVVARVCLDMLRSRKSRAEEALDADGPEPIVHHPEDGAAAESAALVADSIGLALLVVLETLAPAERVAFVLHDMFDLSFDEIASILGRSPAAARQLASRARRRVQGTPANAEADLTSDRRVVDAFLAASRGGDLAGLLAVLDPEVVLRADHFAVEASAGKQAAGAPLLAPEVRGAAAVAESFSGRARFAQPALVDGAAGAVWAPGGQPRVAFGFSIADGKILEIEVLAAPESLRRLDLTLSFGA